MNEGKPKASNWDFTKGFGKVTVTSNPITLTVGEPEKGKEPAEKGKKVGEVKKHDLQIATSVEIIYMVGGKEKSLKITKAEEVKPLVDAIEITKTTKGEQAALDPFGQVIFGLPGGGTIKTMFVEADQLDRARWGQVYLNDKFYKKVCEIASKAEGKPIDVLKNN